ncbi:DnaD domain protein [Rubrobacter tropicus]|uniref:DnaD domain protein n=1 Tax=Rubrobacter tropicus TaxID=2653851 RepID=A0A6G8Q454_9ACTN|nr:DnaD domain protein [Rubrobacter tropicus]QIN81220.1 DnaD domain protein [Rubrobacter tropicus]
MERLRLTPPGETRARGGRARLYVRWMPHLGAEAVALYELLRVLPDVGHDAVDAEELAELLRLTPEGVGEAFETLVEAGFVFEREGWLEVAEHPPAGSARPKEARQERPREVVRKREESVREAPVRDVQVVRAEPEGVSADDYFRFMGTLPAPHILEFLNGYCGRDGLTPDAVREALKIASERDARRVGYVRSILERWVERGVKTVEDVERFEQDRKLRLVQESGAVKGGALKVRESFAGGGVRGGTDRQSAARRREGYEWLFGEEG